MRVPTTISALGLLLIGFPFHGAPMAQAASRLLATDTDARSGENTLLVKDTNDAMKGVPPPKMPAFPSLAPKPRTARGSVKDMNGKPIAGAHIIVQASAAGGFRTDISVRTDAAGLYEMPLPIGVCRVVNADCTVTYNDKTYVLPLRAVASERKYFNSQEGGVENFVLQTYGAADPAAVSQRPESGMNYYGGSVRLVWFQQDVPEGGILELTLQPKGALLGNVPARTLVFRVSNKGTGEAFLNDIPLGRYTMRGKLHAKENTLPLHLKSLRSDEKCADLEVNFESVQGEMATLERSGVQRFDVMLTP